MRIFTCLLPCGSRCIVSLTLGLFLVLTGVSQAPSQDMPDGEIDTTFGTRGRVLTDFRPLSNGNRSSEQAKAVAIQTDGKIVAVGHSDSPNGGDFNFALVRYHNTQE
jgi:hypothetical protein